MSHTPGPWTIVGREINGPADSGVIVARLPEWGILADGPDPAPANAALIAAAPELLEALVLLLNVERAALLGAQSPGLQGLDVPYHFEAARAAIARATGQS